MPRDDRDPEQNQKNIEACTAIALAHGYTLSLQMHKLLQIR
jgi:organic radical activating enzyme